ncbi:MULTISPECIES: YeiH family protein [Terrabacteria group]|uniref:Putative membrane protein YeiH n=5 Tax=Bacillati TaxID=1783272 RepID=A0A161TQJ7_BACCE|nr:MULTISPECIES: YeiH family protein [Bacillus cereus group]HDR7254896.1 YeiH family putative sulfate export transporter [Bacillus pacificus]AWC31037.1 putative sulfate exporter family transporter [Bacillus cytotoxicus]AWC35066.1 putative sulfate exporter family transporter [Bacillus cytotoxicus]AWC39032.1 putative sulfate exporter family transporter [Bacillus cytotoxicus]AWC43045.1 putative sulfate exporter family transporter [Bacillus cytotoxicus]
MTDTLAKRKSFSLGNWLGGIGFTFIIALVGFGLSKLPVLDHIGQLACAIIIAVIYRQIRGYPEKFRTGIQFSAKRLLRFAIILFGLKLNIDVVLHQGLGLLVRDVGSIVFAIFLTILIGKLLKADSSLSLLLGIGTGVCGAAAIAAVSPILKAKDEDTAIGAGIIALVGTIFAIGYTILRPFLPLTDLQYGIWSGVGLHEIAHVALAGAPAGPDGLAIALLAKLGRVFLLVPLSFILMYWMKRKGKSDSDSDTKIEFPWFLIGFIIMSLFGSYVLGNMITIPTNIMNGVSFFTSFILTMAMIGLGLNVSLKDLRTKALRPLLAMTITSVLLSVITYFTM